MRRPASPASPGGVAAPSICSLFGAARETAHRMYDAEPRSNPGTNSRASCDGCHAASGKTRFGKNRAVSAEIREREHQAGPGTPEDGLDGPLHQLEDVGEGPRLLELRVEVHRPSNGVGET